MFSAVFLLLVSLLYYSEADLQISGSVMIATRVRSIKFISDVNLSRYPGRMVAYHQWNQVYSGGDHFISNLRAVEALNTQYTLQLQKFDNNTNIYSSFSVHNASNGLQHVFNLTVHCSGVQRKFISLVDDDYYRYQVENIITYTSSDNVKFSCQKYLHLSANLLDIQIGLINTAGDKIYTFNQTEIVMKLAEVHNGSMLCCLYYTTSAYKNGKHIQRFVMDNTLLIYQKETPNSGGQPRVTTTESYCEGNRNITKTSTTTQFITDASSATGKTSNNTNKTGKTTGTANKIGINSGTANGTGKNTATINETAKNSKSTNKRKPNTGTLNETGKNTGITNKTGITSGTANEKYQKSNSTNATDKRTGTTNRTDSSDHDADSSVYVIIIIISSISATMLLLLVGTYAIKKRCWKKTTRHERAQLPLPQIPGARLRPANEPDPNTPFYLNLLFKRECELEIQALEEPQYEEIMYQ